ncbi:Acetyl-CoA-benzylalcohol acetyltransferase [Heracleum sosnowskyi]|uniref:Acetyl-CoA-benzylalcohol acetyltransferase n=1 Tax=Heracleum sosnowskyi TaxID=360622 RepID=A0AAD8IJ69_9APIA|nr:Acetyl-CoA-benzylalcohol acetyltransferase [Heracleum sosnowskyi]
MKVQIHSKKQIKPFTPTPSNLNQHNLSFIDELAPKMYAPVILYYPCPENITDKHLFSWTCMLQLETSLSKTLVQFYPLAGRYNKRLQFVDCNDKGVEFIEASVDCHLQEILPRGEKLDSRLFNNFIPCEALVVDEAMHPLLAIQVTVFKCGGLAIGVCISHRIADAATLSMFLEAWGAITNLNKNENQQEGIKRIFPCFDSAVYFPKRGLPHLNFEAFTSPGCKIVTKRFTFDNKAISTLRANIPPDTRPTSKLQLVIAVIWKALLGAEKLKNEHSRATHIMQPVNLRNKNTTPVVHKHCFGNLCILASVPLMAAENAEIHDLAVQLSNSVKGSLEGWTRMMSLDTNDPVLENVIKNMVNYYMISSWSGFPFYETDFGWGKPVWASSVYFPCKNMILLMDNKKGDGFDAWVSLEETDMTIFEQDFNIQAFTS